MKRNVILFATLTCALMSPALAQTTDKATILLQRIANGGAGTSQVYVGTLPGNLPSVPLPNATIVGSVYRSMKAPFSNESYSLYYTVTPEASKAYEAALVSAGWQKRATPLTGGSGFVASTTYGNSTAFYCKQNAPTITESIGQDPRDLEVYITTGGGPTDILCGSSMMSFMEKIMNSPLPPLHAPQGVNMTVSQPAMPNMLSAAYIHNGTSPGDLLAGFASQMSAAGWEPGAKSTGNAGASQTFSKADAKSTPWECVISIYAVQGKPGEFAAFINVADLSALSKGTSTLFDSR